MDPDAFLEKLATEQDVGESLVHVQRIAAREPSPHPLPEDLPHLLVDRLGLLGIDGLYFHQQRALEVLRGGDNVVVATGTASGKTLVYNLAFAADVLEDSKSTALYLFPTKALARDQVRQVRANWMWRNCLLRPQRTKIGSTR